MKTAIAVGAFVLIGAFAGRSEVRAEAIKVEGFTFNLPEGWRSGTPSSPMRKAQLEIARGPEKAGVTLFHLGAGQGGSAPGNAARWHAQLPCSERTRSNVSVRVGTA